MENDRLAFRMLFLVSNPKLADKANLMFKRSGVPLYYRFNGKGTASSEIKEILGLGNIDKMILISILPKPMSDRMLQKLNKELILNTPNSGIAFSTVLSGGSGVFLNRLKKLNSKYADEAERLIGKERNFYEMSDTRHALIMAIVNQGYSEDVMDAAREAGATGGTVLHAREAVNEDTYEFWGVPVQPEREIIMIISSQEDKLGIMKAIGESCGLNTPAKGLVVSMPVDNVAGIA